MVNCAFLQDLIACVLMGAGLVFLISSLIGMLRLPDFYSRVHASGNSETLGMMLVFLGLAVYEGITITSAKIIVIFLLVFIGNPIGSHILAKAAYKTGCLMWTIKKQAKTEEKEAIDNANIHS